MPRFADLCEPLRALMRPETPWIWSPECQSRFEEIKRLIASPPVLAHFDASADTFVTADASGHAVGACLSQRKNGVERPVAFASRVLSPAERKYSASEREALAALWACEKWHFYLYGRPFTLVTDHQALTSLLSSGGSGHRPLRLHRWASRLYRYSFKVLYKPGKDNVVTDCLSRVHPTDIGARQASMLPEVDQDWDESSALVQTIFGALGSSIVSLADVAVATASDELLQQVARFVVDGWPPSRHQVPPEVRVYFDRRLELSVLHQTVVRGLSTVIPSSLRQSVLSLAHEGHPGIVRMKRICRDAVWWPGINTQIEHFVRDCTACIVSGKSVHPVPGPLQPLPWPSGPWRRISIDSAGEFVAAPQHQRFVMVAVDHYSKWPEAAACGTVTSSVVIEFLTSLFDRFGLVEELVTDNGVQFTSSEFQSFLKQHGIRHCRSSLYAPQSNAAVERFNRVLKEGVWANMAEGRSLLTSLRQTLANYRSAPHSTTGVSPSSLMLAFQARTPVSVLAQPSLTPSASSSSRVAPSTSSSRRADASLRKTVSFKQSKMAAYHDRHTHAVAPSIVPGDQVRILLPRRAHKLARFYSGPHPVKDVRGNMVLLQNGQRWNLRRCIRHRSSLSAKSSLQDAEMLEDVHDPDPASFDFAIDSQAVPGQVQGQPPSLRRSSRTVKQRDFGPVISH